MRVKEIKDGQVGDNEDEQDFKRGRCNNNNNNNKTKKTAV